MSEPLSEAGGAFGRVSLVRIDRPVAAHAHPQCHALFKVGGGDGVFEIDGRPHALADGKAVLVNAWQPHAYPLPRGTLVLALYIEPEWLGRFEPSFAAAARRDFFSVAQFTVPAAVNELALALAEELRARPQPQRALMLLQRLITELALRYSRHREFPAWQRTAAAAAHDRRIRKAMALIAERCAVRCDMDDVAREAALSRPHFFELFKAQLGVTPGVFRSVVRMEHAYRALLESVTPVRSIAADLGFSAPSHFTRFFSDNHGVAPKAYRRAAWRIEA